MEPGYSLFAYSHFAYFRQEVFCLIISLVLRASLTRNAILDTHYNNNIVVKSHHHGNRFLFPIPRGPMHSRCGPNIILQRQTYTLGCHFDIALMHKYHNILA